MVRAYVLITATAGKALEVVRQLQGKDGVIAADAITGEFDVIAQVKADDVPGIGRVIVDQVQSADGVFKTITCLAVSEDCPGRPREGAARLSGLLALYGRALARLRSSARLRRSLLLWSLAGLVLSEGLGVGVVLVHGAEALVPAVLATFAWWLLILAVVVGGADLLRTPAGQSLDHYGVPNGLSALRAWACVPLLLVAMLSLPGRLALMLWAGVGGTVGLLDAVDGAIARRYGPVSVLGKAIDPFGDALFFVVGAFGCYLLGIVPLWLMALILFRYAAPVLVTPFVFLAHRRPELVYTPWGRRNTILTGVVLFILFWVRVADGPVWLAALCIALPTLVPTGVLHFASLARRALSAPTV